MMLEETKSTRSRWGRRRSWRSTRKTGRCVRMRSWDGLTIPRSGRKEMQFFLCC
jgi:hypothetical protein